MKKTISVIVCSRGKDITTDQRSNVEETADVDVEIVVIDNSANTETIFSAYNKGVKSAKGDLLCFVHDDVMFRTNGWGRLIETHFLADEKLGMIGFAGAHFLPNAPMYWDESPFISEHNLTTRNGQTEQCFSLEHFCENALSEVAAIDGMCFFVRRSLFDSIAFDEATFNGFHLYDMDISMQVRNAGFKVCVCNDVLVEHFYDYNPSKAGFELFEANLRKFYEKWLSQLPLAVGLGGMTEGVVSQLNEYVKRQMEMKESFEKVRKSKAYRLGKTLLHPLKALKR